MMTMTMMMVMMIRDGDEKEDDDDADGDDDNIFRRIWRVRVWSEGALAITHDPSTNHSPPPPNPSDPYG